MDSIADRLRWVQERMADAARRSGRSVGSVRLVAVTKTVEAARIREAVQAGIECIGENYVQEAQAKQTDLADLPLEWRLVGHLQTNKAAAARSVFQVIESLDSLRLARALLRQGKGMVRGLVEVRLGEGASRSGVSPENLPALLDELASQENLVLEGLMGVAPRDRDPRGSFARLKELFDRGGAQLARPGWTTLSMGMSADFEVAVEEGSTEVRIGTALFGRRAADSGAKRTR